MVLVEVDVVFVELVLTEVLVVVTTNTLSPEEKSAGWILLFGWLSVTRHLAFGSHAEDLGFTDQVIWNFLPLRGQWFRMSLYQGAATWNTHWRCVACGQPLTSAAGSTVVVVVVVRGVPPRQLFRQSRRA